LNSESESSLHPSFESDYFHRLRGIVELASDSSVENQDHWIFETLEKYLTGSFPLGTWGNALNRQPKRPPLRAPASPAREEGETATEEEK
jgi:hypothetical protein